MSNPTDTNEPPTEGILTETQEINNLKGVLAFLQDFPVQGRFAPDWTNILHAVANVANSLIRKQDNKLKAEAELSKVKQLDK